MAIEQVIVRVRATMTTEHPRWGEFLDRLEAAVETHGCAGRADEDSYKLSRRILIAMDFYEQETLLSLLYFAEHGGFCDCVIAANVGRRFD